MLINLQNIFLQNLSKLFVYANELGYLISGGELYRTSEMAELYAKEGKGIVDSLHCQRLAMDINLFDNTGNLLADWSSYRKLGDYWESLHPNNQWGGYFLVRGGSRIDSDHFEMKQVVASRKT